VISDAGQPDSTIVLRGKRNDSPEVKLLPRSLSRSISLFSVSLFIHSEGGRGTEGYRVGGCRLHRSYQAGFIAPRCNSQGGEAVGLHGHGEKA
jgi:hypothetical protein